MIKINLLPTEELQQFSKERKKILAGLGAGTVGGLLVLIYMTQYLSLKSLERDIAKTNAELVKVQPIVDEVARLEAAKAQVTQRRNVIQGLLSGRLLYPKLMEELMTVLPKDVWLMNLRTTEEGSGLKLEFSAKSFNNFAIADWIMMMEGNPHFSNIDLKAITTTAIEKASVLDFGMSCTYTGN